MNRVKIVRSGFHAVRVTIVGSTRSIHGVSQSPPLEKMFCISMQRWTACEIGSAWLLVDVITFRSLLSAGLSCNVHGRQAFQLALCAQRRHGSSHPRRGGPVSSELGARPVVRQSGVAGTHMPSEPLEKVNTGLTETLLLIVRAHMLLGVLLHVS